VLFIEPITITSATGEEFTPYLAWEFGAGAFHNSENVHPKAAELGMGVGTYNPASKNAMRDGWFYKDKSGEWHYSHGTEATMPLFNASLEMIKKAETIIKGAFW
jgi:hypothetical protein